MFSLRKQQKCMKIKKLHNWNLSYSQAIALQKSLSEKVHMVGLRNQPKTIAGIDCASARIKNESSHAWFF